MSDDDRVKEVLFLALSATANNVGDVYVRVVDIYTHILSAEKQQLAEYYIAQVRSLARQAEIGWKLFANPPHSPCPLSDAEQIQLITIIATLNSFSYGVERLDESSFVIGPDSTPVRFYINSLYHFIAALYLLDKDNDPMGGMVYKTLHPMGFDDLLAPVRDVLNKSMDAGVTFGETIRRIRNDFLVHGTFSPADISAVVRVTKLHDRTQILRLTNLIWELFNQSFILKLKLIGILTASGVDPYELANRFIARATMP